MTERIAARLDALWALARGPAGGADRPAYSAAEAAALRLVAGWAREAALEPALDEHGNLWAAPAGHAGPLATSGSHVDTVPDGGRYDGALGTVLALEAAVALAGQPLEAGAAPGVIVCAAEEAPRFGAGTLGSRLMTGALDPAALHELCDADGMSAHDARAALLAGLGELPRRPVPLERVRGHVEVHVEQRPALARAGFDLGVVERVAAPRRRELVVRGVAGHAGEIPMAARHDALVAAAELVLALEAAALADPDEATVATVGVLRVDPGVVSAIPGQVALVLEVRGTDARAIGRVEDALDRSVRSVADVRGVTIDQRVMRGGDPVALDPRLTATALDIARRHGLAARATYSGAGHDVQHLAARVPAALLFVPLTGGASHTPQEQADPDAVDAAAAVLVELLRAAASASGPDGPHWRGRA